VCHRGGVPEKRVQRYSFLGFPPNFCRKKMRILCEVFGLFDKRGASGGGTPYIIRGAWGLGADKGAAERRLTGGRKYAPKGNGKDEKEKKERAKGKRKREKAERRIKSKPKEDERKMKRGWKEDEKRMEGGCTSANATERLRHTSPKTTRLFSTARMFGANTRFSPHLHNRLLFNALHQQAHLQFPTLHVPRCG
ncbi:hypothetical protein, partial [Hallella sp.]|uniref:hypothetical protein n=1 Tax=Hallella sp. TaxID=2980186 RepID=UPI00307AD0D8